MPDRASKIIAVAVTEICILGALTTFCPAMAHAEDSEVRIPARVETWKPIIFPKIKKTTTYSTVQDGSREVIAAHAQCSASAVYVPIDIDLARTPLLSWRWRINQGLPEHDERQKSGDDFAARVYVMFRFDPEHASLWSRARHQLGTALYGDVIPGNAVNYVWSSRESIGAAWANPFSAEAQMVVTATGAPSGWAEATVDVGRDYEKAFGVAATAPLGLAVMVDADNTCGTAAADFGDFRFHKR